MTGIEDFKTGSVTAFDKNWVQRKETGYNHYTRGMTKNQIQLAFRSHWEVFSQILRERDVATGSVLEAGCGRGSLSCYFAEHGWKCHLLDASPRAIETAQQIFTRLGLDADYSVGDVNALEMKDESFDVVFSIGLLEHFEDVRTAISEQLRILRKGGVFIGYIVPERPDNVQRNFNWINSILKFIGTVFGGRKFREKIRKEEVFRSDLGSERYLDAIKGLPFRDPFVAGMYPMPMISHSPEFPFTLLPAPLEFLLARIFSAVLFVRKLMYGRHGWLCDEKTGQAFLLVLTRT